MRNKTNRKNERRALLRLLSYLKPYALLLVVLNIFALTNVVASLAFPLIMKIAIDEHIAVKNVDGLLHMAMFLSGLIATIYITAYVQGRIVVKIGYKVLYDIRRDLFNHIQDLSFRFFDTNRTGRIMSRLTNDVQVIEELLQVGLDTFVVDTLLLIGVTVSMFLLSPHLSIILCITLPLLLLTVYFLKQHIVIVGRRIQQQLSSMNAYLNESISGIKVIRAFARETENLRLFKKVNNDYYSEAKSFFPLLGYFWQSVASIDVTGTSLVLLGGGILLSKQLVTLGVIAAFLNYISRFFQPIQKISNMFNQVSRAVAASERIFELLDEKETVKESPHAISDFSLEGNVQFKNIRFSYNKKDIILDGLSFSVAPGETCAIVGPTGSGKSTIINLVSRFYDPIDGDILVDGINLKNYSKASYRNQIALVMQESGLFSGTIYDAIRYGREGAGDEEIVSLVKRMGFHESIVQMKNGYETQIGERGSLLSLGQKQLIAFARALIRDPKILILDEASAYLDSHSEALVQKAIEELNRGRTSFIIAHRLSTIRNADKILVIEDGRVLESGTHDELVTLDGKYAELLKSQYSV